MSCGNCGPGMTCKRCAPSDTSPRSYQRKPNPVTAVRWTEDMGAVHGVWKNQGAAGGWLVGKRFIRSGDWIINGDAVMTDDDFREEYESFAAPSTAPLEAEVLQHLVWIAESAERDKALSATDLRYLNQARSMLAMPVSAPSHVAATPNGKQVPDVLTLAQQVTKDAFYHPTALVRLAEEVLRLSALSATLPIGPGGWVKADKCLPPPREEVVVTDGVVIWKSRISDTPWCTYEPGCGEPVRWMPNASVDGGTKEKS